jgi:hypothetical protein
MYPLWLIMKILRWNLSSAFCNQYGFGFFCLGKFYFYNLLDAEWKIKEKFNCKRPLKIDFDNEFIFWGDYISNKERTKEINVYRYSFTKNELVKIYNCTDVRHVHAVKVLSENKIIILTGDYGKEAKMIFLDKSGKLKYEIKGDNQLNRAVDCCYNGSYLYYGTDTQIEQNYLCRYSLESKDIELIKEIEGPVFNMWRQGPDAIGFTVSCEVGLENIDTIFIYNYHLRTGELTQIYRYSIPLKLNNFLQVLLGIPTFEIHQNNDKIVVTNNYYLNFFRKQISINFS